MMELTPNLPNVSLIVRSSALIIMFFYILASKNRKIITYTLLVSGYLVLFLLMKFLQRPDVFAYELVNTIKTFYFLYTLIFLRIYYKDNVKSTDFFYVISLYLLFILVPNILNIGFRSYEVAKAGSVGWFYSANDISMILCMTFPFLVQDYWTERSTFKLIVLILLGMASVIIGTKSILLTILIVLFVILIYAYYSLWKKRKYAILGIITSFFIVCMLGFVFFIPTTNFYKNIIIHLEFLGVKSINDIIFNLHNLDHFVFSQRLTFLRNTNAIWLTSQPVEKILGLGYVQSVNYHTKLIEMDIFDIFYVHGLIGCILYFIPVVWTIKEVILRIKGTELKNLLLVTNILIIFLLSLIVGHTFTTPTVAFVLAIELIYLSHQNKNKNEIT